VITQQSPESYKEDGKNDIRHGLKPYYQGGKYNTTTTEKVKTKQNKLHQTKQQKSQQTTTQ
jgi:hypothetical protein